MLESKSYNKGRLVRAKGRSKVCEVYSYEAALDKRLQRDKLVRAVSPERVKRAQPFVTVPASGVRSL